MFILHIKFASNRVPILKTLVTRLLILNAGVSFIFYDWAPFFVKFRRWRKFFVEKIIFVTNARVVS